MGVGRTNAVSGGNSSEIETIIGTAPGIAAGPYLVNAELSSAVSEQLSASCAEGGSCTFSASGLPSWASLSSSGLLTGTPSGEAGTTTVTVIVSAAYAESVTTTLRIVVADGITPGLVDRSITEYSIPSSVTYIGEWAFSGCRSLTSIFIPSSVTSIGSYAFYYCSSLTSIVIPSGVTSIESSAFSGCSSLTSIFIPSSVTSIGSTAFNNCTSLTDIYCGFAAGAVSGAPWGATNATIHYNSTGE